ncbi:MAG: hypothetical protein JG775_2653, partial [Defluviitaleaceae bacterium]|nr:hypothetical protein [Defluviitaleaceae bacterium]MBZ4672971.1 hypothetical protein [Deferribacteraceae bacterium]
MSEREDKIYEDITQLIGNTPMI